MAKLNRIRIINFYYNNDIRKIADETFSFYDGENALFNLSNGGGKSVLIQLILQPIIPDHTIQKRTMSSFFKKNPYPAYVLLEWLLDNPNKKDYLMTGIAISSKITNDENASQNLSYFTFGNHYSKASEFDIASIPFSRKEDGKQIILSFEKAREEVKSIQERNTEVFYYAKEEALAYRNKLAEFKISQEEWKNIIAKMNEDEGGIDKLFERCGTSDKLVDEWIIKTVEKALMRSETENTQISDLMEGLVTHTISNAEHIKNKKNLTDYLEDHKRLETGLFDVCGTIEKYHFAEDNLHALYRMLVIEKNNLNADMDELHMQTEELEKQQQRVDKEEKSEKYYECFDESEEAKTREQELKEQLQFIEEERKELEKAEKVRLAAKKHHKTNELKGDINALTIKLNEQLGSDNDVRTRIRDLKYSLKKLIEQDLDDIQKKSDSICIEILRYEDKIKDSDIQIINAFKKQNENKKQLGELETKISNFIDLQKKTENELVVDFQRNILGELDNKEIEKYKNHLQNQRNAHKTKKDELIKRLHEIKEISNENQSKKEQLISDITTLEHDLEQYKKTKKEYIEQEEKCNRILEKYELSSSDLFDHDIWKQKINIKSRELEDRKRAFIIEQHQIEEIIHGINIGQIYIPKVVTELLEQKGISYQTGEMYLKELTEERRNTQLKNNSLLPFSIIVDEKELKKLEQIAFDEAFIRQLIILFTYEDLRKEYKHANPVLCIHDGLKLIHSFESNLFQDDKRQLFLDTMESEHEAVKEKINNILLEINTLQEDIGILKQFTFESGYIARLENKLAETMNSLTIAKEKKDTLEKDKFTLIKEYDAKEIEQEKCMKLLEVDEKKEQIFMDFLADDKNYIQNLLRQDELNIEINHLDNQIILLRKEIEHCKSKSDNMKAEQNQINHILDHMKKQEVLYANAEEGVFIKASIEILESEYNTLKQAFTSTHQELERQIKEKQENVAELLQEIKELDLVLDDYQDVIYNDAEMKRIRESLKKAKAKNVKVKNEHIEVHDKVIITTAQLEYCMKELNALNMEQPLPKEDILQNYANRRKKNKLEYDQLNKQIVKLKRRQDLCIKKAEILQDKIDVNIQRGRENIIRLEDDIEEQCRKFIHIYNECRNSCTQSQDNYKNVYDIISRRFMNVHPSITDILGSLENLELNQRISYDKVYYYAEELMKKRENLEKLLDFFITQLETIEDTKRQVIEQCVSYANLIFDGFQRISVLSKIKLPGKNRPTQMLKMNIPPSIDSNARLRMQEHIEFALKSLVDFLKKDENDTKKRYKEKIHSLVSTRQLINQLIGKEQIPVQIYKIDLNESNSGMKSWEDAMKQNSGGEKFVCFFTVASTLISYTREMTRRHFDVENINESKVMIMDNPFARTSSEHLLKAVIEIAKTFNIQLICFSDLSQSSITNRFHLIYTLSIRKKLYSDKEVLYVEDAKKEGLKENEKLEHVALYQTYKQRDMFELLDEYNAFD